ncbi:hypothetical protein [Prescottella equi]|uniref:Uncharacterized protein n=1 Tax=Prescottella equi ATCC 33707 TaxID=525370 RepID=E9T0P1_RHOHA|nr:hypothetical protein [Prescottella equi]EGD23992.1 hypothetical protein HMPREF0724_12200 [Prescottella equi ATCC 33707]
MSASPAEHIGSKLFISCDLVGSTSHKQSAEKTEHWIPNFLRFYYDFPARVRENLQDDSLAPRLNFWKAVGDELIFTLDIQTEADVFYTVNAWVAAMHQYESELEQKNTEEGALKNKMKTKGGAFIATFPDPDYCVAVPTVPIDQDSERDVLVRNEEMKRRKLADGAYLKDYLGPSIDTGFRVVGQCTQRYFTLSLEVAWAMAHHQLHAEYKQKIDGLTLLSESPLKGVWNDRSYPIFAIDRQHRDPIVEKLALVRGQASIPLMEVHELAEACLVDSNWPSTVYFPKSAHEAFTRLKTHLTEQQSILDARFDRSGESVEEFTATADMTVNDGARDPQAMAIAPPATES